jgi:hypothetical protein
MFEKLVDKHKFGRYNSLNKTNVRIIRSISYVQSVDIDLIVC